MPDPTAPRPLPEPTPDTRPFWDALAEQRLILQQCAGCGKLRHYPRPLCDACFSMDVAWVEASGQGKVHSWTVTHHAFHPSFKGELPYLLVTVDLDEGVRMVSRLLAPPDEPLAIGTPVQVVFEDTGAGFTLPLFRLARDSESAG